VEIMQQAVLEFDEAVQVPWRPAFGATTGVPRSRSRPALTVVPGGGGGPTGGGQRERRVSPGAGTVREPARPASSRRVPERVPAGRRPDRRPGDAPVRLTRRGRRLLIAVSVTVGLALGALVAPLLSGSSGDLRLAGQSRVLVRPGDTLWSIATSAAGADDVRVVVDRIERLNHLQGDAVQPGQELLLP
jgi:nucleoid-associated protein YgaU